MIKDADSMKVKKITRISDIISEGFELIKRKNHIDQSNHADNRTYNDTDSLERLIFS